MSEKDLELAYDEDDSVEFIQNYLPSYYKGQLSNDDINYLVDLIYEYYEDKGYLSDDADDDLEIDQEELVNYVFNNVKPAKIKGLTVELIETVIEGELSYCESLDNDDDDVDD